MAARLSKLNRFRRYLNLFSVDVGGDATNIILRGAAPSATMQRGQRPEQMETKAAGLSAITTYQEALDYLYRLIDPARRPAASPSEAALNLLRTRQLLEALGNPDQGMPAVVVAGTKGKGSTSVMIEAIARAAGLRVGLWSSPHLSSYRERIQVNRELISRADLMAATQALAPILDTWPDEPLGKPSTFDAGLAIALSYFRRQRVDLAVLEVGLGGRFDSTNVVQPLVSAITSISFDHTRFLGPSLAKIAWNKAGIIKAQTPVISAVQAAEAWEQIAAEAAQQRAPWRIAAPDGLQSADGTLMPYPVPIAPRLPGAVQIENGRIAVGVACELAAVGLPISLQAMATGLAHVEWPGRFEVVATTPQIIIDGAHNGDSAARLVHELRATVAGTRILVLGLSADKDAEAILAELIPWADHVVLARSRHPRAQVDFDRLAAIAAPYLGGQLHFGGTVREALALARNLATPTETVVITGSLFVAAEAREALGLAEAE